jgi:macrolide-specific efflux system membrane fusion protein
VSSTGTVEPQNRLEIKPPISGRIDRVLVEEGDIVSSGQMLAWMSSTERAALLDAAMARGAEEYERWNELYKATPILSPLNGAVISRQIERGQTVSAATTVLVVSDRLVVSALVDETDIGRIKVDQKTDITLDAYPEQHIQGVVARIAYEALTVNNVTVYEVEISPQQIPEFMKSGMTAEVNFVTDSRDHVLTVPATFLVETEQGSEALLWTGEETSPRPVRVQTGIRDEQHVEIVNGLAEDDVICEPGTQAPGTKDSKEPNIPFLPKRPKSLQQGPMS